MKFDKPIYITRPNVASLGDVTTLLQEVWDAQNFTNNGPMLRKLENALRSTLHIRHPVIVNNGTIAIHIALRALQLSDCAVITTPFTWIATSSCLLWENCTPIFVDINPHTFNIDVSKIEAAITPQTKAILAVHVFSNPCDVESIEVIAKKHNLAVIYDAAHAFGVEHKGRNIYEWGDLSTASFHATKVFNTAEGGAIICSSQELYETVYSIRDFGFSRSRDIVRLGTNAKMSEIHAVLGLANLPLLDGAIHKRKMITECYKRILGNHVDYQQYDADSYNYAYMPIILKDEPTTIRVVEHLQTHNAFPRRYFHPSLSEITVLFPQQPCPISEDISKRILCLPIYPDLTLEQVEHIAQLILSTL